VSRRKALILAATAGVCLLAFFFIDLQFPSADETRFKRALVFPDFDPAGVDALVMTNARWGQRVTFRRAGVDDWAIESPFSARANKYRINGMLREFEELKFAETSDTTQPTIDYGFEQPALALTMQMADGKELGLIIGARTEVKADSKRSGFRHARHPGQAGSFTLSELSLSDMVWEHLDEYRDQRIFTNSADRVDSCRIEMKGERYELEKRNGQWYLLRPVFDRAKKGDVERLLSEGVCRSQRFLFFNDDPVTNLAFYGFDRPTGKISIRSGNAQETVILGRGVESREEYRHAGAMNQAYGYLEGKPGVFSTGSWQFREQILAPFTNIREEKAVWLEWKDVRTFALVRGKERLLFDKTASDAWTMLAPQTAWKVDGGEVNDAVNAVIRMTAARKIDHPKATGYGFETPTVTAVWTYKNPELETRIKDAEQKEREARIMKPGPVPAPGEISPGTLPEEKLDEERLVVGSKASPTTWHVRRGEGGPVLIVDDEFVRPLIEPRINFRERYLQLPPGVRSRYRATQGSTILYDFKREIGGVWHDPDGQEYPERKIEDHTGPLARMRARDFVAETTTDLARYGLDSPAVVLQIDVSDEATLKLRSSFILHIGSKAPDGTWYARVKDDPSVFTIDDENYGAIVAVPKL
jgi:hypothetical protein